MSGFAKLAVTALFVSTVFSSGLLRAQDEAAEYNETATTVLDMVVVTASRTAESLREVSSNVTVIGEKQIKNSTAKDMAQLMSQEGFQVINNGPTKMLRIRGMGQRSMGNELTSEVLVLINGRRTANANIALMGLDNVERVEIIRGPSAVQFGPSAMGGVVNIITKRGGEEFEASAEAGFGSDKFHKESLAFSGLAGTVDFAASVTNTGRDNLTIKDNKTWKNTAIDSTVGANMDLGYNFLENHRLGANFIYYKLNDSKLPDAGWSNNGAIHRSGNYNLMDKENYNLGFTYEGVSEDGALTWMANYAFGRDESTTMPYAGGRKNPASYYYSTIDIQTAGAQIGYDRDMLALAVGFDYAKYDLEGTYNGKTSYKDTAGYISGKLRLFEERFIVSAGGRYDKYDLTSDQTTVSSSGDNNFSPSIGVAVLPLEALKLRANYSEGFKMPTPAQVGGSMGWYTYLPNSGLKPEKSKTFELGADLNWDFIDASLTYFHTKWDDKIMGMPEAAANTYKYRNLTGAVINGVEFTVSADLGQAMGEEFELRPYLNLTYLTKRKNKDETTVRDVGSDTLLDTPKLTANYGLTFVQPAYGFMANINAKYYGGSLGADYRLGSPSWPNTRYVYSDNGTVVDLSLEKKLFNFNDCNSLSLRAEVNNIFDDKNEAYLDYPDAGRSFYVGLKYNYN